MRTIFRSFNDKESLYRAFEDHVLSILEKGRQAVDTLPLVELGKFLFTLFEKESLWIEAHLLASNVTGPREKFRQSCFRLVSDRIKAEYPAPDSPARDRKIALITTMLSGNTWSDLRRHFGYTGVEMCEPLGWAIEALLKDLKESGH